jgi:hypothetical protein
LEESGRERKREEGRGRRKGGRERKYKGKGKQVEVRGGEGEEDIQGHPSSRQPRRGQQRGSEFVHFPP